jgi:glycosyltransferase involved in cell wall biosynthesis
MVNNGTPRRRRRVAHLTLGLDVGGQEKLLVEMARHADRRRFELFFLSLTNRGRLASDIEALGYPVVALEGAPGFRPRIAFHVAQWLRRWRIDVLHTHDSKPLIYGAPAAQLSGIKRLVHTRHFARLGYLTRRQTWLAQLASRLVDDYVCVSRESLRVAQTEGIAATRLRTVWNGIDTVRFAEAGPSANGPGVLVARLSPEKDVATLLHAVAIAVQKQPSFRLEIAGDGVCLPDLRALATSLRIESAVKFLGEVSDVAALLKRARFFVLSSLTEGVSLTLLEAMASGLPVVATRVGGNPEVVVDGETGFLTPAGDPLALANAMLVLNSDLNRSIGFGSAGRRRVEQWFDVRRMVGAYEAMYAPPVPAACESVL